MDVISKARELCKAIAESDEYIAMEQARKCSDNNKDLQDKINDFNLKKIALNREVNREDKNSDKIAKCDRELREAYNKIMEVPDMIVYANAKQNVDKMMQKVQMLIDLTLMGNDPETVEIPENVGCSGDCSACGGGCH